MPLIVANVSLMFDGVEPRHVSGSQAELGLCAAQLTWNNAKAQSTEDPPAWLASDKAEALAGIRGWASSFGAWDDQEIEAWTDQEVYALFVQQIAHELRMLGSDDCEDLTDLAEVYESTDWDNECEYPTGSYYLENGSLFVQFYASH